jgi:hypothetical protein
LKRPERHLSRVARPLRVLVALAVVAGTARAEEPKANPWTSKEVLERRFAEALGDVEKVCAATFDERPTVRVSTPDEIEALVREEVEEVLTGVGREDQVDLAVAIAKQALIGKYDPETHVVHVVPENVERVAKDAREPLLRTEECLRAVLAHEATHALDFRRFPLAKARRTAKTMDELEAWGAVVEGHAQLVAEEVAASRGLADAFAAFTRSISAVPDVEDATSRRMAEVLAARASFGYVSGHAFLRAVRDARGREGVDAALREPPRSRRVIENPSLWLDPGTSEARVDLEGAIAALGPLFEDPAFGIERIETDAMLRGVLATQLSTLAPDRREEILAGYEEGTVVVAVNPSDKASVIAAVLAFRTEEAAGAFLAAERETSEKKDSGPAAGIEVLEAKYSEGAGVEGKRKGFFVHKRVKATTREVVADSHFVAVGRYVIEMNVLGDAKIDRSAQDAAVDRVASVLEGKTPPPARLARRSPEMPPSDDWPGQEGRPRLTILVLDADGNPVPLARVTITGAMEEREGGTQRLTSDARSGRIVLPLLPGKPTVSVSLARDREGRPLPLAPVRDVPVPDGQSEITVRLLPGLAISGLVVDPDGKPVEGVSLHARDAREPHAHGPPRDDRSKTRSDEDGVFRIVGVADEEYDVLADATEDLAAPGPVRAKGGATDVRIVMVRGEAVTLTLVDEQARPVPKVRVVVEWMGTPSWRRVAEGETDARGLFVLPSLDRSARYRVQTFPPEWTGLTNAKLESWAPQSQTVLLPEGFSVRGLVVDEFAKPIAGALVDVGVHWSKETGEDGRFEAGGLPKGPVNVRVRHRRDGTWVEGTAVATPEKPVVVVTLGKDARPVPTVRLPFGVPQPATPPTVEVRIEGGAHRVFRMWRDFEAAPGPDSPEHENTLDEKGVVRITSADFDRQAKYVVWVAPRDPDDDLSLLQRGVRIDANPIVLKLAPGRRIRGRLLGASDLKHVEVDARTWDGLVVFGKGNDDGGYEIRGLPEGTRWTVKAKARAKTGWVYATAEAEAGSEVDLTLAPK